MLLKLVNDIEVTIDAEQPGYINEHVALLMKIKRKSAQIVVKHVLITIHYLDKHRILEIVPGVSPPDLTLFYLDEKQELTKYDRTTKLSNLEFEEGAIEMALNFSIL